MRPVAQTPVIQPGADPRETGRGDGFDLHDDECHRDPAFLVFAGGHQAVTQVQEPVEVVLLAPIRQPLFALFLDQFAIHPEGIVPLHKIPGIFLNQVGIGIRFHRSCGSLSGRIEVP